MMVSAREIVDNWKIMEKNRLNKFVSVDKDAAQRYAHELKARGKKIEHWHFPQVHPEDDFAFASVELVNSALNFCYPIFENPNDKFSVENPKDQQKPFRGAIGMQHCFYRAFGENRVTAELLKPRFAALSKTAEFFKGTNQIPLLEHRHWIMQEVISVLKEKFGGDPLHIYEEADWDAVLLVDILTAEFPQAFGDDISRLPAPAQGPDLGFTELEFRFFKKAKLAALLYQGRALEKGSNLKPLRSMSQIIAVEDYQVPKWLQWKKVLIYSDVLREHIRQQKIIHRHSQMEIEIRAPQPVANSIMLEELNRGIEPDHPDYWDILPLDAAEWFDGRKIEFPHHLTPTTAY